MCEQYYQEMKTIIPWVTAFESFNERLSKVQGSIIHVILNIVKQGKESLGSHMTWRLEQCSRRSDGARRGHSSRIARPDKSS